MDALIEDCVLCVMASAYDRSPRLGITLAATCHVFARAWAQVSARHRSVRGMSRETSLDSAGVFRWLWVEEDGRLCAGEKAAYMYSRSFYVLGLEWRLLLFPNGNLSQEGKASLYLDVRGIGKRSKVPVDFVLCLKSEEGEVRRQVQHVFKRTRERVCDYGFREFAPQHLCADSFCMLSVEFVTSRVEHQAEDSSGDAYDTAE